MAGLSPTTDINQNPLAAAAFANTYGPQTVQALRRSQYLADALKQIGTEGSRNIQSPGELISKLLATAILQRSNNKGQDALAAAMRADQNDETTRMLAPLAEPAPAPVLTPQAAQSAPQAPPQAAPAPPEAPQAPPPPVAQAQPAAAYSPQDQDALTRMLATEALGEGPAGMAAAGHVALNRLKAGYGGAKSLHDVVYAPHQFTGMAKANQVSPEDYARAGQVADAVLSGRVADPTGGAQAFLNPELTQQLYGRIPAWAQGPGGQRIGRHVFFGGQQVAQNDAQPPGPPPPPNPNGPDVQNIAAGGAGSDALPAPPTQPSAPGLSPPAAGTPPAAPLPQASAAGGPPQWPTQKPTHAEYEYVQGLLMDPRTHAAGVQKAQELRYKMTQPVPSKIVQMNGLSFYVPDVPGEAPTMAIPVPREAMTHTQTAQQAGITAPPGTTFDTDPLGNHKPVFQPATGQMVTSAPGQPYTEHYIPGGANDPTRPQPAQQGYQYSPGPNGAPASQAPIPGGPADPKAPLNILQGTQSIQKEVQPIVTLAGEARTSVGAVRTGYTQQNGAGDIAMVNGLQHLIDKGVVRGEDVNMQMKSNGISGSIGSLTQYLNSGGLLTPQIRSAMLKTANDLFVNTDQQLRARVLGYRQTVDNAYGSGAFDRYVFPKETADALGWSGQPAAGAPPQPTPNAPQFPPGTREAAIAEARKRGLVH